ncbi:MAG: hypothetical protein KIS67_27060 [Verrucomicrobiae bacterium]|nr:hypothetical protein [Verrucomicrobiae bacterium]
MICLLLAWLVVPVRAELQFEVSLGYDRIVREASWFPVVCEIQNDGAGFAGVIEWSPGDYSRGQIQQLAVELPTGTHKRVTLPAFAAGRHPAMWTARLLDDRGRVRAEQLALRPLRQIGWETTLLGALPRTAAGTPALQPIKREQTDGQPAVALLKPESFPDNSILLEGLDAIYLNSDVAVSMRGAQVAALLQWLDAGGHLMVALEQTGDVSGSPWLQELLPCQPEAMQLLPKHPELHAWLQSGWTTNVLVAPRGRGGYSPVAADQPFAELPSDAAFESAVLPVIRARVTEGQVRLAAGELPLIVTANRGYGRVTTLLFSPEREPMRSWEHLPTFWAKLAGVPGALYASSDFSGGYGQSADGIFGAMIDSRQVHKLPIGWLLMLLVVYLVVIGPLDQWWLKRIGKPMLTWITFPCYVGLFALMIYYLGYRLRAGETEFNELHVVDVLANGSGAEFRGRTYASVYSPSNQKYPVASAQRQATLRGESLGGSSSQTGDRTTVRVTGDRFTAELLVPVWTSQLYISDWRQAGSRPLVARVVSQGEGWEVNVRNLTDRPMTAAQLVVGGQIIPLGELPPGQGRSVTLAAQDGLGLREFVAKHAQSFRNVVQQRQYAFGESKRGQLDDLPNVSMATSFLTQGGGGQQHLNFVLPRGLDLARVLEHGNAVLLAWVPDFAPVEPLNRFKPRRSYRHTLWRMPVNVERSP